MGPMGALSPLEGRNVSGNPPEPFHEFLDFLLKDPNRRLVCREKLNEPPRHLTLSPSIELLAVHDPMIV